MPSRYTVPEDVEEIVDRLLESRAYSDADEIIRAAMLALEVSESDPIEISDELRAAIEEARADIEKNGGIPAEEVFAEMDEIIRRAETRNAAE
jgi:Arc/MetJ-type ribon-helix-helix transcriptional regulator